MVGYSIKIILGAIILFSVENIRWFLLYFLVIYLISSEKRTNYLRKLIQVYQFSNEIKIAAISKKLKVTEKDIETANKNAGLTKEQIELLNKDFEDLKK